MINDLTNDPSAGMWCYDIKSGKSVGSTILHMLQIVGRCSWVVINRMGCTTNDPNNKHAGTDNTVYLKRFAGFCRILKWNWHTRDVKLSVTLKLTNSLTHFYSFTSPLLELTLQMPPAPYSTATCWERIFFCVPYNTFLTIRGHGGPCCSTPRSPPRQ